MKKTTMKAKVFAAILAAVTACSVTTAAMATTVSAAQLETTQTFENNMKKVGVDAADAAFFRFAVLGHGKEQPRRLPVVERHGVARFIDDLDAVSAPDRFARVERKRRFTRGVFHE